MGYHQRTLAQVFVNRDAEVAAVEPGRRSVTQQVVEVEGERGGALCHHPANLAERQM